MKCFFVGLITIMLISIGIQVNAKNQNYVINSLDLINYLKDNNLLTNVSYVCTKNTCSKKLIGNKEKEINMFINDYVEYIKNKSLEEGISLELKGFEITKIIYT